MKTLLIILVGFAVLGFATGLVGKSIALNKKSLRKNEFFNKLTAVSIVMMFIFAILYHFLT
ncbi:MAG: hypothetical protein GXO89_16635 [Chlorobi bacterium]|nr:hypothetical protein [Chlorobiota bacterium]